MTELGIPIPDDLVMSMSRTSAYFGEPISLEQSKMSHFILKNGMESTHGILPVANNGISSVTPYVGWKQREVHR